MLEALRILVAVAPLPPDKKTIVVSALKLLEFVEDENQREATLAVIGSFIKKAFDEAGVKYEIG
jgi:hypothetical protein